MSFYVSQPTPVFPASFSPGPQRCKTSEQFSKLLTLISLMTHKPSCMGSSVTLHQRCTLVNPNCITVAFCNVGTHMLFCFVFSPCSFHCLSGLQPLLMKCDQNKCRDNSALCHPSLSLWSIWSGSVQFVIRKVWLEQLQSCSTERSASSALMLRYLISLRSFHTNPGLLLLPPPLLHLRAYKVKCCRRSTMASVDTSALQINGLKYQKVRAVKGGGRLGVRRWWVVVVGGGGVTDCWRREQ